MQVKGSYLNKLLLCILAIFAMLFNLHQPALALPVPNPQIKNRASSTSNEIKDTIRTAKYYKLVDNYKNARKRSVKQIIASDLVETSKQLCNYFIGENNKDSAFVYLKNHGQWEDSLSRISMELLQRTYESPAIAKQKKEVSNYKFLSLSIFIVAIFLVATILIVLLSKRTLKKQNKTITQQHDTILAQMEEIKKQNEQVNHYKNDLEDLVHEKTKHLEEALKKAEESDQLKTAFLTNMSHEIHTPMNAILGFSSLLTDSTLDEKSRNKYIEVLIKSTEQLHRVISDIIKLSKIESGHINVNKTYFDINVLFQELMLLFGKQLFEAKKSHINLEFNNHLESEQRMLVADRNIIKQVLINLIDNSIKFTKNGSILFGCRLSKGNKLEFYVKDTGIGIEEEHHKTIFKRFRQIEGEERNKNKGIGLGLPISKGMIEKIGGEMYVKSEVDKGANFYFAIPFETHKDV